MEFQIPGVVDRQNFLWHYPQWMIIAKKELGTSEIPGAANDNPRITAYISAAGYSYGDETPWCSAFVNWVLQQSGYSRTLNLLARSWLNWGEVAVKGRYGAITILTRPGKPGSGHVGFFIRESAHQLLLLGGNQSNKVGVDWYAKDRLLGFRWPCEKDFDREIRYRL